MIFIRILFQIPIIYTPKLLTVYRCHLFVAGFTFTVKIYVAIYINAFSLLPQTHQVVWAAELCLSPLGGAYSAVQTA